MTTEIMLSDLGSFLPGKVNYSKDVNAFLTNGFTSAAGNTYFNAVRIGKSLIVKEDNGHGYTCSFLNGLKIYSIKDQKLLMDKSYHCNFYSIEGVKSEIRRILDQLLHEAAEFMGVRIDPVQVKIAIDKEIEIMFNTDQRELLQAHAKKLLKN